MHTYSLLLALELAASPAGPCFERGDSNSNLGVEISDAILTLRWLFSNGRQPDCISAADADDNGAINITDPILTLHYLFAGGAALPAPSGGCGHDPTADELGCAAKTPCDARGCGNVPPSLEVLVLSPSMSPVEGATVHAAFLDGEGDRFGEASQVTRQDGRAAFEKWTEAGEIVLIVLGKGYQLAFRTLPTDALETTVVLKPAVPLAGTVLDAGGKPVAGAQVLALPIQELADQSAETSTDGSFALDHLPPGTTHLAVLHTDFAPAFLAANGDVPRADLRLVLDRGIAWKLKVSDAESGDAVHARALLSREPEDGDPEDRQGLEAREESVDGVASLLHRNPGTYVIDVDAGGYLPARSVVVVSRDGQEVSVLLHPASAAALVVTVLDAAGDPIAHAGVSAYEPSTSYSIADFTDAAGTVELRPVPRLPLIVRAQHESYLASPGYVVPAGSPAWTIVLDPDPAALDAGTAALRFVGTDGRLVPSFWAVLSSPDETVRLGSPGSPEPGGEVSRSLLAGDYRILAGSEGRAGSGTVRVSQGETASATVTLAAGITVRGVARDAPGAATVTAGTADGALDFVSSTADESGSFTLAPVPAGGGLILQAEWPGGEAAHVSAPAAAPGSTVDVVLSPRITGGLDVKLLLPGGRPAAGAPVKLSSSSRSPSFSGSTDADGRWKVTDLPSGYYMLSAGRSTAGQIYWWPIDPQVLVLGNEVRSLTFEAAAVEGADGGGGAAPSPRDGIGAALEEKPQCRCRWEAPPPTHSETFCGFDRNYEVDGGKSREREFRCQAGAVFHAAWAFASIHRPWRVALLGWRYAEAHALEAQSGSTEMKICLKDRCYYCEPKIKGEIRVRLKLETTGGGLAGSVSSLKAIAGGAMSVSGDLNEDFVPQRAAATICGVAGPSAMVNFGKFSLPVPAGDCSRDSVPFEKSKGPRTRKKDEFSVILNGNVSNKVDVRGLVGRGLARSDATARFKIHFAVCEGKCNHQSPGCPQENDVILLDFPD